MVLLGSTLNISCQSFIVHCLLHMPSREKPHLTTVLSRNESSSSSSRKKKSVGYLYKVSCQLNVLVLLNVI